MLPASFRGKQPPEILKGLEERAIKGELTGDDEEFFDAVEQLYDAGYDHEEPASLHEAPTAIKLALETSTPVSAFYSVIPGPNAPIWSRIPSECLTDEPDEGILETRKERFREMVTIWLDCLFQWFREKNPWRFDFLWQTAPVSFFVGFFLWSANSTTIIDYICKAVTEPAQYLLADPDFEPEDLLKLPRISKKDTYWGCYFDLLLNPVSGLVEAWYSSSATAFGCESSATSSGLIGRLISYFPKTSNPRFGHERKLDEAQKKGQKPNFRKVADCRDLSEYHRVYCIILESFLITLVGFDVEVKANGTLKNLPQGTPEWVKMVRRRMGVRTFERVEYINRCLAVRQGCKRDTRFQTCLTTIRQCANPVANCPTTQTPTWFFLRTEGTDTLDFDAPLYICTACYAYWKIMQEHRSQELIDKDTKRKQAETEGCYWCDEQFPLKGVKDRKTLVPELNECLCKRCYLMWKPHSIILPVRGIHYSQTHVFACENSGCTVTKALQWFFEEDFIGSLLCERCHLVPPYVSSMKNGQSRLKKLRNDSTVQLHEVQHDDCHSPRNRAGFLLYCQRHFGFSISGNDKKERAASVKAITEARKVGVETILPLAKRARISTCQELDM
ncbi:hypothetical protein LTR47_000208 [Exophiala xenobiotica]|nr:hypothetical protein LTR41_003985 [Exophiala xenobiotica]KAK5238465.1 hypothetical protein LTR47_000208 [Exophiala xenobiotica]KAK5243206.1 hypothetical protein LTS06_010975 [Exophiala xenobiotica]KAK5349810.1 hypothetical protein LTR61_006516 [Exophiala xenobiotica]KAK5387272.1 hypothetical protein LTR11_000937 [Exophiala xenobiotica]